MGNGDVAVFVGELFETMATKVVGFGRDLREVETDIPLRPLANGYVLTSVSAIQNRQQADLARAARRTFGGLVKSKTGSWSAPKAALPGKEEAA